METMLEASVRLFAERGPFDSGTAESAGFSILASSLCNLRDFLSSDDLDLASSGSGSGSTTFGWSI